MDLKIIAMGDVHGYWTYMNQFIAYHKPDIILQCGDFGYWPRFDGSKLLCPDPMKERTAERDEIVWDLNGIECGNTTIFFCDGNHEDHWALGKFGNQPTNIFKNVWYMPRGSVAKLPDGRNVLFMGGAESIDKNSRILGYDWFPEETITQKDLENIPDVPIDIVISHTAPLEFVRDMGPKKFIDKSNDPSCRALSAILHVFKPDLWYFGHFHHEDHGTFENTKWQALNREIYTGWTRQVPNIMV